jgi:plastocyanin
MKLVTRWWRALLAVTVLAWGIGIWAAPASQAHVDELFCEGRFTAIGTGPVRVSDNTRFGSGGSGCETGFSGFPLGVAAVYEAIDDTTGEIDPTAPAEIHVEVWLNLADGTQRKYAECEDGNPAVPGGQARFGSASCSVESNGELGQAFTTGEPLPNQVVSVQCFAHTHARVKVGTTPTGHFGCYSSAAAGDAMRADMAAQGVDAPPATQAPGATTETPGPPTGPPAAITAVPPNTYEPTTVPVTSVSDVRFANLDSGVYHDVVALDATRPADSAPWCSDSRFVDGCPLFYTPLILGGPGATKPVLGLSDAPPGDYRFYCTIHPSMVGTIQVVG